MENYKKKYEEKFELARNRYYDLSITDKEKKFLEKLFPILKESQDERIRLSIIKLVKQHSTNHERCQMEKWLNEQRKVDILTNEEKEFAGNVDSYRKEIDEAYQRGFNEGVRITLEKQKSDGTKPKFKVGDWVVYDNNIVCHIDRIYQGENSLMYTITDADNKVCSYSIKSFDNISHLWTIQDAKDGDVLTTDSVHFMFKSNDNDDVYMYCSYDIEFNMSDTATVDSKYVHPATKEQRELLFQKMYESGYEWDTEKKKLKKIEQKPSWSREGEYIIERLFCLLDNEQDNYPQLSSDFQEIEEIKNKLKSIKEKYTWKPSDEQMEILYKYAEQNNYEGAELTSLYQDLKKLREE